MIKKLLIIFGVRYIKPMNIDWNLAIISSPGVVDVCSLLQGSIKDWAWTFLWLANITEVQHRQQHVRQQRVGSPLQNLDQITERSNYKGAVRPWEPASGDYSDSGGYLVVGDDCDICSVVLLRIFTDRNLCSLSSSYWGTKICRLVLSLC